MELLKKIQIYEVGSNNYILHTYDSIDGSGCWGGIIPDINECFGMCVGFNDIDTFEKTQTIKKVEYCMTKVSDINVKLNKDCTKIVNKDYNESITIGRGTITYHVIELKKRILNKHKDKACIVDSLTAKCDKYLIDKYKKVGLDAHIFLKDGQIAMSINYEKYYDELMQFGVKKCDCCDGIFPLNELSGIDGELICDDCKNSHYICCENCGTTTHEEDAYYGENYAFCCPECCDEYGDYDDGCEESFWSARRRKYDKSMKFNTIPRRTYGIELETSRFLGEPTGNVREYFSGVHDGSISGVELVSGIMKGDESLDYIKEVINHTTTFNNAEISTSCGFHLHVDVNDYDVKHIKKLQRFGELNEELIFALVPQSRRRNEYARKLSTLSAIHKKRTLDESSVVNYVADLVAKGEQSSEDKIRFKAQITSTKYSTDNRYVWLNFVPVARQGTVEIRIHSATLDATKVINWVRLWTWIIDKIKKDKLKIKKYDTMSELIRALGLNRTRTKELVKFYRGRTKKFIPKVMKDGVLSTRMAQDEFKYVIGRGLR